MRHVLSSLFTLVGAAAAVLSPFLVWYDGSPGSRFRAQDLVNGATGMDADLLASVFLPLAFAAFVALIALAMRSRLLVALAGLLVLATAALWLARQADTPAGLDARLIGPGLGAAVGGGVALLVAAALGTRHGRRGHHRGRRRTGAGEADGTGRAPWEPPAPGPRALRPGDAS